MNITLVFVLEVKRDELRRTSTLKIPLLEFHASVDKVVKRSGDSVYVFNFTSSTI